MIHHKIQYLYFLSPLFDAYYFYYDFLINHSHPLLNCFFLKILYHLRKFFLLQKIFSISLDYYLNFAKFDLILFPVYVLYEQVQVIIHFPLSFLKIAFQKTAEVTIYLNSNCPLQFASHSILFLYFFIQRLSCRFSVNPKNFLFYYFCFEHLFS